MLVASSVAGWHGYLVMDTSDFTIEFIDRDMLLDYIRNGSVIDNIGKHNSGEFYYKYRGVLDDTGRNVIRIGGGLYYFDVHSVTARLYLKNIDSDSLVSENHLIQSYKGMQFEVCVVLNVWEQYRSSMARFVTYVNKDCCSLDFCGEKVEKYIKNDEIARHLPNNVVDTMFPLLAPQVKKSLLLGGF